LEASTSSQHAAANPLNAISVNVSGKQILSVQLPPSLVPPKPSANSQPVTNLSTPVVVDSTLQSDSRNVDEETNTNSNLAILPSNCKIEVNHSHTLSSSLRTPNVSPDKDSLLTTPKLTFNRTNSLDSSSLKSITKDINSLLSAPYIDIPQLHIPDTGPTQQIHISSSHDLHVPESVETVGPMLESNDHLPLLDISLGSSFNIDNANIRITNNGTNDTLLHQQQQQQALTFENIHENLLPSSNSQFLNELLTTHKDKASPPAPPIELSNILAESIKESKISTVPGLFSLNLSLDNSNSNFSSKL